MARGVFQLCTQASARHRHASDDLDHGRVVWNCGHDFDGSS
jgi:hypothetical protein